MAYDRADWHYGGDFPADLPDESGGTHIGVFLAWAIMNNLEGELHRQDSSEALSAVRERQMTGREFLFEQCDEKFWEEDLNDVGNAFAREYYGSGGECGPYFTDYEAVLAAGLPSFYHIEDTWDNYDKLAPVITSRFREWSRRKMG
jgi:hypothetical protein